MLDRPAMDVAAQAAQAAVYSVSELTALIKDRLASDPRLSACSVTGEISNFKHHTSGHMYFTLKDEQSRIRAVMFARRARSLTFLPKDGMRVIVRGSVSVFERDGQYQLYVDEMQPDGIGALYVAFTQLRDRLAKEGLFAAERKRPLPTHPRRIGVVTSPTGAVIRDICSTLRRRYPLASVLLAPARVQGEGAAETIVAAISQLVRYAREQRPVDVIIIARGGGSLEELWPFNEEVVARAVAACPIPVVSAVGHETDFTICDFVADVRAATPTAAAELVAPSVLELRATLAQWEERMRVAIVQQVTGARRRLDTLAVHPLLRQPERGIAQRRQLVDYLEGQLRRHVHRPVSLAAKRVAAATERLHRIDVNARLARTRSQVETWAQAADGHMMRRLSRWEANLETRIAQLTALNPLAVLSRGYALVYRADGKTLLTQAAGAKSGESLRLRFSDGWVAARVTSREEGRQTDEQPTNARRGASRRGEQIRLDL
jgi:exodeoxyribonuclease VII large subunit